MGCRGDAAVYVEGCCWSIVALICRAVAIDRLQLLETEMHKDAPELLKAAGIASLNDESPEFTRMVLP
jgi:hypothetical protein